jgi:hypothetical protein
MTIKTLTKNNFFYKVFLLLLFEGTFTLFFKDKKKSRFFILFLLDDRNIRIRIRTSAYRIGIQEAQKHRYGCDGSGSATLGIMLEMESRVLTRISINDADPEH